MKVVLITGGARSGKSRYAETLVSTMAAEANATPIYIATAEALDPEMTERIAKHKERRSAGWQNVEAPIALNDALSNSNGVGPRLVDCLTLWLSNLVLADMDWEREAKALCMELTKQTSPVVLVTNEVGLGIVPDNALARRYRDNAGLLNQMVVEVADTVFFTVAGLPMKVK